MIRRAIGSGRRRSPGANALGLVGTPFLEVLGRLDVGDRVTLRSVPVQSHIWIGRRGHVRLGNDVAIDHGCGLSCQAAIEVGAGTVLGPFVQLLDSDFHLADDRERESEPRPIRIGRGAVIGAWSIVLPGSTIGQSAVVAPGSVVVGSIPDGACVSGNPASDETRPVAGGGDPATMVPAVFAEVLGLSVPPSMAASRDTLADWSSLGSVRILAALERATGRRLPERVVYEAATVGAVVEAVRANLADHGVSR